MPRPTTHLVPTLSTRFAPFARPRTILAVLALAVTAACGGGGGGGGTTTPTLQSISVAPGTASEAKGLTQAFAATGHYSDGSVKDLTSSATWASSDTSVATVAAGAATGVGIGQATISAASGGQTGQATLTVTAAALQSISVSPGTAPVAKGLTQAFAATGHYSDGTTQDLTAVATWTSSDAGVATISSSGVATGVAVGLATISATYGGQAGQATLTVITAALQSISVAPGTTSVAKGLTAAFGATGHYSDGTTQDLTAVATWTSSDAGVATISSSGVATGVAVGLATISAAYGGQTGQATLTVAPAALQSISVSPGTAPVAKGLTQAFAATGHYSDGTTQDLTALATWTSSDTAVATITSSGVATGVAVGLATISAAYGGQTGQATLTVVAAALQSVSVAPESATIAKGLTAAFTATGHYSDGTTQDLTATAAWTSSDETAATVAAGTATGVGIGLATISAAYGGQTGQATLTVTAAALQAIAVAPTSASVAAGLTQAFTATGQYSDGTTQDLTVLALWTSADPGVATVSASGVATSVAMGATAVFAAYGGQMGQATLTVTAAVLQSVAVAPPSASVAAGLTQAFTATGQYSDGSTQDLTALAAWSSSDATIATVSAGTATGLQQGLATITAAYGGLGGDAVLTVDAPVLQSVAVAPSSASVAAGLTAAFTATGRYSDGSTQDVTLLAVWSSSDASVATVSTGIATGVATGQVTIDALYDGQLGTASLQVTAPVLQSVDVSPGAASIAKGLTQAFAATGHYSDGSAQDLTSSATWASSDASVATVSSSGVATAVGTGSALVTATSGGKTGQASLVVSPAALQSVAIAPQTASVAVGLTQAFTATGHYTDGTTQDLTSTATWTSSDATVATVSSSGIATGVAPGTATVSAASGGQSGQATLTVTGAIVQSVSLSPASASVASGLTQTFSATAHWSDGSTSDATVTASWTTADPSIATATGSVVKGVSVGSTQVRATLQGVTGSATLTVTAAVVQVVAVSPANATLAAGTKLQYSAQALYSDGSKQDVTASASWASSSGGTATINAAGLATGVAVGATTISATFSSVSGTTPLAVTSATLTSISISPSAPTVPAGFSQPFTATGVFSDGTKEDLTAQVAWTSSAPGVATISAAGVATAVAAGNTGIGAALGGVSDATTLTVTSATLTALSVTPVSATIAKGTTVACSAIGTYSDGTTEDLTALATWTSSGPAVTVSNAAGTQGVATGAAVGTANVTASYGGFSELSAVTVTNAVLQSIAIAPSGATVPAGATQALTATGTFSDGTAQDLTALASWTSSDTAVAAVSNSAGTDGVVTAIAAGSVTITAAYSSVSGTAPLTVSAATLVSIQVSPANDKLPAGYTLQFRAVGTYSDLSTRDLTTLVTWASSNTAVATISNAAGSQGLATGVAWSTTPVLISATLSGKAGSTGLTVTNTRLSTVAVTPDPFSVAVGATLQLTATGTFQDGTVLDVTNQVGWSTSPHGIATVSRSGLLTGVSAGATTVTAKKTGKSGTTTGTVY